ncbi:MAG: cation transporter [Thermococci archaeon]|nr:cation transporter [Thermococci archaeon]
MKEVYKPMWVSIAGNVLLAAIKLVVGVTYSSIALISDGIHSLSDVITSVGGYFGIKVSLKPADSSHPFGHSRFEPLVAFIMGEVLLLVAYEIARDAVLRIIHPVNETVNALMIGVAVISIASKEGMFRYSYSVGKRLNNQILIADSYHHRSDALSSVAVLVGLAAQRLGFRYGDAVAALFVTAFLVKVSIDIILTNMKYLTGSSPDGDICREIRRRALSVDGVLGVHDLRAHYVGTKLHVELHIEVSPDTDLKKAHDIAEAVKKAVEDIDEVEVAFVHVDIKGITR